MKAKDVKEKGKSNDLAIMVIFGLVITSFAFYMVGDNYITSYSIKEIANINSPLIVYLIIICCALITITLLLFVIFRKDEKD